MSLATTTQLIMATRLPPLLDHHIASCSCCCYTMDIAGNCGLAGPIACLDRTRVVDDLVVVFVS